MRVSEPVLRAIREHAAQEYPRESCGLVVVRKGRLRYMPCRNVADGTEHFAMHPQDLAAAEDEGELVLVVHSHPNLPPQPSQADLVGCEASGVPWLIVNWPTGAVHQFSPTGYTAPLFGRVFSHGVLDCYTFIKDYYRQTLGLELPNFERPHEWWLNGRNLYLDGFESAGFTRVQDQPRLHDVLLMRVAAPVPNHGAVCLGNGLIGHHQTGRLSSKDVYGGWYEKVTTHVLRHRSLLS